MGDSFLAPRQSNIQVKFHYVEPAEALGLRHDLGKAAALVMKVSSSPPQFPILVPPSPPSLPLPLSS